MAKTDTAADFLAALDLSAVHVDDTEDLAAVAAAADRMAQADTDLIEAVKRARAQGRSWNRIAVALGVSRQAARQRFGRLDCAVDKRAPRP
ncbi:MAG: sigma-70 family RNA polymerase sigma factor [Sporichthyaceae bacterium]